MLSVGNILKKERLRKGYSLADVEKKIKVRQHLLAAVEADKWSLFSSKIYIVGVIKNYSDFLGLDPKKMLAFFRREYERTDEIRFKKKVASSYLKSDTRMIAVIGLVLVVLFFLVYFGYQLFLYLLPPKIFIIDPKITTFKHVEKVQVIGKTDKESTVTIFNQRVYQNKDGFFEYDLPLREGKNRLTIEVTGANGKHTVMTREFVRVE